VSDNTTSGGTGVIRASDIPPLRQQPGQPDTDDSRRAAYAWAKWNGQNAIYATRDRTIEEMIRCLSGQQWWVWYAPLGRFVDAAFLLDAEERRWRQRPVFNRLLPWFLTTHARFTENPPIVTFLPGPDEADARLAEMMDNVFKALWRDAGMVDVNDRLWAWVIVAGMGYTKSRIDLTRGELEPWITGAAVPLIGPDGQPIVDPMSGQPITTWLDECPLDQQGNPLAYVDALTQQPVILGEPHVEREGGLVVDVLSPFSCRGEWGDTPWHLKQWHADLQYLEPAVVEATYGVKVEPEALGTTGNAGELERVLFGNGNFGANMQKWGSEATGPQTGTDGFVRVLSLYERPRPGIAGMEETLESAGGRMLVVTGNMKVLYDGPRPIRWPHTSPINRLEFVRLPGSNSGRTPLETQIGPQRAYNRGWAQIIEHRNLVTNPIALVDRASGLHNIRITNQPGKRYIVNGRPNVDPMKWLAPPDLGQDVYRVQELLLRELTELGNLKGTEGEPPQRDASGELIKELRFNSDRFLGPTVRRAVEEYGRMIETWMVMLPRIWSKPKVITMAGEDHVAQTLTVYPELFEQGRVQVVPDVESMLPEGLGERQQKALAMYREGMFGAPGSPQAVKMYLDLARFPHLSRAARPGGVQRKLAEEFVARLIQGADASSLPWYPWYDPAVHLDVLVNFMASKEYLRQPSPVQAQFARRWMVVQQAHAELMAAMAPPPDERPMPGRGKEAIKDDRDQRRLAPPPASARGPRN
jgi:hypothetical protein